MRTFTLTLKDPAVKKRIMDKLEQKKKTLQQKTPEAEKPKLEKKPKAGKKAKAVKKAAPETKKKSARKKKHVLTPEEKAHRKAWRGMKKTIENLCQTFPQAFVLHAPRPLKIGIFEDIIERMPDFPELKKLTKTQIRKALKTYTGYKQYHQAVLKHTHRINLEDVEVEEIPLNIKEFSEQKLEPRKSNVLKTGVEIDLEEKSPKQPG